MIKLWYLTEVAWQLVKPYAIIIFIVSAVSRKCSRGGGTEVARTKGLRGHTRSKGRLHYNMLTYGLPNYKGRGQEVRARGTWGQEGGICTVTAARPVGWPELYNHVELFGTVDWCVAE